MRSRRRIRQARRPALALGAALAVWLAVPAPAEAAREGRACEAEPTDMIIEYGDLITCAIRPAGDSDLFRLAGSSGQTVRLQLADLTAGAATPCLQLRDPAGEPLPGRLCGSGGGDFLLERTGTYGIVVTENPDVRAQVVRYALVAERIDPTSPAAVPIKHGQTIADEIRRAGDLDSYFLEAEAGDRIALEIADRTPGAPAPCFQLYDPTGAALAGRCAATAASSFCWKRQAATRSWSPSVPGLERGRSAMTFVCLASPESARTPASRRSSAASLCEGRRCARTGCASPSRARSGRSTSPTSAAAPSSSRSRASLSASDSAGRWCRTSPNFRAHRDASS